ncbi:MAG TPA: hypothetical protein VHC49_03900 [Mycobacteriales bacterium]|nr:hypothetical protein [Mycobacteriales bacterium]
MPKRSRIDWDSVDRAAPHQVLSLKQLVQLGVPRRTITTRCSRTGPWSRVLPGVVLLNNGTPTGEQRVDAALRYAGADSVLTGNSALHIYGISRAPAMESVHVLVPADRRRASQRDVVVERTTRIPEPNYRSGFPVAPITRAALDAARRLRKKDDVNALLAAVIQRGATSVPQLLIELERGSDRGSAVPRAVLRDLIEGVRSPAESWGLRLVEASQLPNPTWNVSIFDKKGEFLARPDAWFDEVALAWQIDSLEFHLGPADYATTLQRHAALTAAGVIVVHTLPGRLRSDPDAVVRELQGAYRSAATRPRPPVIVRRG